MKSPSTTGTYWFYVTMTRRHAPFISRTVHGRWRVVIHGDPAHVRYSWPKLPGLLSRSWYNEWKGPTIDNDAHSYWIPIELGPESTSPFLTVPYVWRALFNLIYTCAGGFLLWRGNDAPLIGYRFSSVFSYKNRPVLNKRRFLGLGGASK